MTRLTIELVPSTAWFSNVRSEVTPKEWDTLKKRTSKNAGGRCEICGGRGRRWPVEAHEVWLYDEDTLTQKLERLIALCPLCHSVKHIGFTSTRDPDALAKAIRHLANVNGWTEEMTSLYIESAFEIHALRSQLEWTLDISVLKEYGIDVDSILERRAMA